ncbi:MAG: sel1 repeat family protein [Synergistaceae bacterium]|nr:sel1 repeat family protein [Synergistaceae bacterium]
MELNINFETETQINGIILQHMKAGKLEAQMLLGKMYAYGEIVSKDYGASVKFYKMAAEQGDDTAIFALGSLYSQGGPNLTKDFGIAAEWYRILAVKGNEQAILGLAWLYRFGEPNLEEDRCRNSWSRCVRDSFFACYGGKLPSVRPLC